MSFKDDIEKFRKKTEKKMNKTFRGTALSLFSKIILRTPVGNPSQWETKYPPKGYVGGRLRANWQASINSPKSGELDRIDESGGSTIADANSATAKAKIGDSLFMVNNLPYAQAIENGHSRSQAPAGMVRVTIAEFQKTVRAEARKNNR